MSVSWTVTVCLTVWLILAPSGQAAATLRLEGLSPGADPRIILTRAGGEGCRDEVIQKGGRAITLSGPCWSCPAPSALPHAEEHGGEIRVAVLARNHSVAYLTGSSICGQGEGAELVIALKPRTPVKVAVHASPSQLTRARDAVLNADWVFNESRAGVTLDATIERVAKAELPKLDPDGGDDVNCPIAAVNSHFRKPELNQEPIINVFFGIGQNKTCPAGDVVFIEQGAELRILAHELSHALGLLFVQHDGDTPYPQGHTNDVPFFDCGNTMWVGSHIVKEGLSLGQAFWVGVSREPFPGKGRADLRACRSHPESCLRFSIQGDVQVANGCRPCTFETAMNIDKPQTRSRAPDFRNLLRTAPRLCTNLQMEQELRDRFALLSKHAKGEGNRFREGSRGPKAFVDLWFPNAVVALTVEAAGESNDPEVRKATIAALERAQSKGDTQGSPYLAAAIKRLKAGESAPKACTVSN